MNDYLIKVGNYRKIWIRAKNVHNARKRAQAIIRKEYNKKAILTPQNAPCIKVM